MCFPGLEGGIAREQLFVLVAEENTDNNSLKLRGLHSLPDISHHLVVASTVTTPKLGTAAHRPSNYEGKQGSHH